MQHGKAHHPHRIAAGEMPAFERKTEQLGEKDLAEIAAVVLRETYANLHHYRTELVQEGVMRRMARHHTDRISEYARYLRQSPREVKDLVWEIRPRQKDLFEGAATLEALRTGSSTLWKGRRSGDPFRVWVPCCGTGEETYSVAITVLELLEQDGPHGAIQVFGTDPDERALETARAGIYAGVMAPETTAHRRFRFFRQGESALHVRREVRDLCLFGRHDTIKDPPLMRMDLVVFRNQLNAFTDEVQDRLLTRFHYSLRAGAVLALGQSEMPGTASPLFTEVAGKPGLYLQRQTDAGLWLSRAAGRTTDYAHADPPKPRVVSPEPPRLKTRQESAGSAADYSQVLLEEQSKAIESLRMANEEIIASNEELQVTNEELVATRTELQAANQELATLSEEIRERSRTLAREAEELRGLLHNIDAAIVTVDGDLRICRFTPKAARLFRLAATDEGRRIIDLQPHLDIPEFEALLRDAAGNFATHEREARAENGAAYRISIRPFRGEDGRIDGAVITAWPFSKSQ